MFSCISKWWQTSSLPIAAFEDVQHLQFYIIKTHLLFHIGIVSLFKEYSICEAISSRNNRKKH